MYENKTGCQKTNVQNRLVLDAKLALMQPFKTVLVGGIQNASAIDPILCASNYRVFRSVVIALCDRPSKSDFFQTDTHYCSKTEIIRNRLKTQKYSNKLKKNNCDIIVKTNCLCFLTTRNYRINKGFELLVATLVLIKLQLFIKGIQQLGNLRVNEFIQIDYFCHSMF